MEENSLSNAFSDSLKDESISCGADLAEVGLDAILEDGLFKDIPFVSTAISLYRIGNSIRERQCIKKLVEFIKEINKNNIDENKRQECIAKFKDNPKFRNQELEYLLVLIDRYVDYDKPQMLAKIYLGYLDNLISFDELTKYAQTIDRFLPGDKEYFISLRRSYLEMHVPVPDSFLRLAALGIYEEYTNEISVPTMPGSITIPPQKEKTYRLTDFGARLQDILS